MLKFYINWTFNGPAGVFVVWAPEWANWAMNLAPVFHVEQSEDVGLERDPDWWKG